MSLIIMPEKKALQVLILDSGDFNNSIPDLTKAINELLVAGWSLEGPMIARGEAIAQKLSKVCEVAG